MYEILVSEKDFDLKILIFNFFHQKQVLFWFDFVRIYIIQEIQKKIQYVMG